ncbi:hypothetical protein [Aquisphaera insulae]|uniref:hypothetical protein n=1 Tax=Aquisphaera insulae TaxID=2712864 RepID=UPI0013EDB3DA|nr:hypothetical protein [Aquisphaera insulae]
MLKIDLFVEDTAHHLFVAALLTRMLTEANLRFQINTRNAVGGHGKAISELKLYQKAVGKHALGLAIPDLLVVTIDANCKGLVEARGEAESAVDRSLAAAVVVACPDPHVERWFFADPAAFGRVVGEIPNPGKRKCERNVYKTLLRESVRKSGQVPILGGLEFVEEIVGALNLQSAARNEPSLGQLIEGIRAFASQHTRT